MNISYYNNAYDNDTKIKDVIEIINSIKSDKRKSRILAIRDEKDQNKRDEMKRELDMAAFSCIMKPQRGINNVESPTFLATLDIDHGPNGETYNFDILRGQLIKDKYVMSLFSSPRGRLKLLVKHDCNTVDNGVYHMFYDRLRSYFMRYAYPDPATSSIASTTFLSWDPQLYLNEQSMVFHYDPKKVVTPTRSVSSGNSIYKPYQHPAWLDDEDAFRYMSSIGKYCDFKQNRNCALFKFACQCAKKGVSPEQVQNYAEIEILASDFTIQEIQKTIRSAYKSVFG